MVMIPQLAEKEQMEAAERAAAEEKAKVGAAERLLHKLSCTNSRYPRGDGVQGTPRSRA
jgi:hypothetical protein